MFSIRKSALVALLAGTLGVSSARAAYVFTTFDGPGDDSGGTTASGINNLGQIVGFSSNAGGTDLTNFVRNTDGTFTTLSTINDANDLAMANGINESGSIVGSNGSNAFLYASAVISNLAQANPGNTSSEAAVGINDNGAMVGQYVDSSTGTEPGFVSSGGTFTILNPTSTAMVTNAQGINNNGEVIGFYANSSSPTNQHGFLFDTASNKYSLINDPTPTLSAGENVVLTQFLGINDQGLAVGYYQTTDGSQHGLIYNTDTQQYTFLDDPNAATSGVSTTQITGINNSDEITGFFVDGGGVQRAFFATSASGAVPIPLPPAAWSGLALLGGLGMISVVRRKHSIA
jgi:probable HAF family extracellular repeat protein